MTRFTQPKTQPPSLAPGVTIQQALEQLSKYEDMFASLEAEQEMTLREMERLRAASRTSSVTYKQLIAGKITLANIFSRLKIAGITQD